MRLLVIPLLSSNFIKVKEHLFYCGSTFDSHRKELFGVHCASYFAIKLFFYSKYLFDVRYDFRIHMMFGSSLHPIVCGRVHVLCPMLQVSLDCPVLIVPSVLFNGYLR